jgi:hypothetical protein
MGKKKNKNRDMWDLSYDDQQQALRDFDDFIAGKKNDLFINNNSDFEGQLFTMIGNRRNTGKFNNFDDLDDDNDYDEIDMPLLKKNGTPVTLVTNDISEDAFISYAPSREIKFDIDDSLKYLFITDGIERIGLPIDSNRLPKDFEVGTFKSISNAFIDFITFNMMPYAMVDDIRIIVNELNKRSVTSYDNSRFKIIYDESDEIYKLYIIDTDSVANLRAQYVSSQSEYQNLIIEANDRCRTDSNIANFYDSKYNNVDGYFNILASDVNTIIDNDKITDKILGCNYIISLFDIYNVVKDVLEGYDDEPVDNTSKYDDDTDDDYLFDDDNDIDVTDEDINKLVEEPKETIQDISPVSETSTEPEPIAIDVEDIKKNMESSAIPPTDNTVYVDTEDKPEEIITVKESTGDDLDFDDLGSIPVIRKPKKK